MTDEVPSPETAHHHPYLKPVADKIQPVDDSAPILLLIGRDMVRVHKVHEQINGPHDAPYTKWLDLWWVIVGEVCLGQARKLSEINVYKTNMFHNGRSLFLPPCPNTMFVKDSYASMPQCNSFTVREKVLNPVSSKTIWDTWFLKDPRRTTNQHYQLMTKPFLQSWKQKSNKMKGTSGWHLCPSVRQGDGCQTIGTKL